jgi:hypothetical protein
MRQAIAVIAEIGVTSGVTIVVLGLTLAVVMEIARLLQLLDRRDDSGDSDDSDTGGGGGCRKEGPPDLPGGGGEPAWWPRFEREFADYVGREVYGRRVAQRARGLGLLAPTQRLRLR